MAHECLTEYVHTPSSDIYAFGAVMFEVFCPGALPFETLDEQQVFEHFRAKRRLPLTWPPRTPELIRNIATMCLDPHPDMRPASFAELAEVTSPDPGTVAAAILRGPDQCAALVPGWLQACRRRGDGGAASGSRVVGGDGGGSSDVQC